MQVYAEVVYLSRKDRCSFACGVFLFFLFIFYCSGFCHTLKWISHGCFKRTASKHVYYLGWNRSPAQVGCMRQALGPGALGIPRGIRWRGRWEGGSGWGTHVGGVFQVREAVSVQFSHSVVSDSLRPHGLLHARLPCPSPTPGTYPNSCPLSRWCHPAISFCCSLLLPPSVLLRIRVFSNESVLHCIVWEVV